MQVFVEDNTEPILQVSTDQNGKYSAGPLYDDKKYTLVKKKSYFVFSISAQLSIFSMQKNKDID